MLSVCGALVQGAVSVGAAGLGYPVQRSATPKSWRTVRHVLPTLRWGEDLLNLAAASPVHTSNGMAA